MIIGLSIYVGEYEKLLNDVPTDIRDWYSCSFSFGIGWVAVGLYILSAALFCVGVKFLQDEVKEIIIPTPVLKTMIAACIILSQLGSISPCAHIYTLLSV